MWASVKSLGNLLVGSNKYVGKNNWDKPMGKFTDLAAMDIDGKEMDFNVFGGKILLITNVACKCGYTKTSYDKMQELAMRYEEKGLQILCFPCNQFMSQEPWTEKEIKEWVNGKWPKLNPILFSKIEVNGDNTHKVYKFLKTCFPGDINWNFSTKFIIGRDGIPVQRYDKNQKWDDIEKDIQKQLSCDDDDVNEDNEDNEDDEKKNDIDEYEDDKKQDNIDEEKDNDENQKKSVVSKDYTYKSIDKDNNKLTCLDGDLNDITFDLNPENKDLLEKIDKVIQDGQNQKKDVKIIVSLVKQDDKETQAVSDAKLA